MSSKRIPYLLTKSEHYGKINGEWGERASFAVQGTEKGRAYEYSVELENGIKASVTPEHNSAIHTIEYPKGKDASLLIDVAHKLDLDAALKNGYVTVDPQNRTVCGGGRYFGNGMKRTGICSFICR